MNGWSGGWEWGYGRRVGWGTPVCRPGTSSRGLTPLYRGREGQPQWALKGSPATTPLQPFLGLRGQLIIIIIGHLAKTCCQV